jgi:hypothetical protein
MKGLIMFRFIGDMFIGWIIFTDSGKKTANKIFNNSINQIKKTIMNNNDLKELLSLSDIFLNDDKGNDNEKKPNYGRKN